MREAGSDTISLRQAMATIHRDPGWWYKVLIGGGWFLSLLGWPLAEGFLLESTDNTRRSFPYPLPRWTDWGNKAIMGMFGSIVDFYFFIFPILVAGSGLLCGTLAVGLFEQSLAGQIIASTILVLLVSYELVVWSSSSAVQAKLIYAETGDIGRALDLSLIRAGMQPAMRSIYGAARLRTLPSYLLAFALLIAAAWLTSQQGWLGLVVAWLGWSAFFYARLITIQLYAAVARQLEQQRFAQGE